MCNRYRPASVVRIRDVFGFTYIESGPDLRYNAGIGPLQPGPFIRGKELVVGQWGLIPKDAKSPKPTKEDTKPRPNNCRREVLATGWHCRWAWSRGQRCLIPAMDFDEPYYPPGPNPKNIWWRLARADGQPWALAGIWNEWEDPETGKVVPSYTMLTQNCDAHPLLNKFHKPDPALPPGKQDKRSVVPIEPEHWDRWLHGSIDEAAALIQLPAVDLFSHGAADPDKQVELLL